MRGIPCSAFLIAKCAGFSGSSRSRSGSGRDSGRSRRSSRGSRSRLGSYSCAWATGDKFHEQANKGTCATAKPCRRSSISPKVFFRIIDTLSDKVLRELLHSFLCAFEATLHGGTTKNVLDAFCSTCAKRSFEYLFSTVHREDIQGTSTKAEERRGTPLFRRSPSSASIFTRLTCTSQHRKPRREWLTSPRNKADRIGYRHRADTFGYCSGCATLKTNICLRRNLICTAPNILTGRGFP